MATVEIQGVWKRFRRENLGIQAVQDVNLRVASGEFVCLVGPSGCGKTTLLNLVAGLEPPDQGRILVDGRPVDGPSAERAVIFQEGGLFPWLNCAKNVEFGLRMRRLPAEERHRLAVAALERVGLPGCEYRHLHELSGGQRQRVAIARALVLQPEVLLCDEPFSALDALSRRQLAQDMVRLWRATRMTVIWVEHNTYLAAVIADRVILFASNPGRVLDEVRIRLPRPRQQSDPDVVRIGDFLAAWLETNHDSEADGRCTLPAPEGAEVLPLPQPPPRAGGEAEASRFH